MAKKGITKIAGVLLAGAVLCSLVAPAGTDSKGTLDETNAVVNGIVLDNQKDPLGVLDQNVLGESSAPNASTVVNSGQNSGPAQTVVVPGPGLTVSNISKVATALTPDNLTNVTLSVPGEAEDYSSDIVFILGHGPASNYGYIVDMIHKMLVATDGTPTKIKIGMVTFADTTEEETVMSLTPMEDTVPGNTVAEYRKPQRENDGKKYTESVEDFNARMNEYLAKVPGWESDAVLQADMEWKIAKALDRAAEATYGINLESALITARDMLASDKEVPAERKHMLVISTGNTYTFDDESGQTSTILGTNKFGNYMHGNKYWVVARNGRTATDYGYNIPKWAFVYKDGVVDYAASWMNFWNNYILNWIEADQNRYVYDLNGQTWRQFLTSDSGTLYGKNYNELPAGVTKGSGRYGYALTDAEDIAAVDEAIPYFAAPGDGGTTLAENAKHAMNYERSQYEALMIYRQMETPIGQNVTTLLKDANGEYITLPGMGFNCYAIAIGKAHAAGEEDLWLSDSAIGYNFMRMMGGENTVNYRDSDTSFFESIENKVLYTCSVGSYVEDYIGYDAEKGNFEFVQDAGVITLKVGEVAYTTAQVATKAGATASYAFTAPGAQEATFWLDYYYGNGTTTEKFIWTYGENISRYNPAALTYQLLLTEKAEEEGTYIVDTNLEATLYPKDSEGKDGVPQLFPVPSVSYEVVKKLDVDVVICIGPGIAGYTTSAGVEKGYDATIALLKPLMESGKYNVKLGLVGVETLQQVVLDVNSEEALLGENYEEFIHAKYFDEMMKLYAGPTNLEGPINRAKEMLDADKAVPAENKFVYVIATGRTYWFEDANGNPATIVTSHNYKNTDYICWGHRAWQRTRINHTSLYAMPGNYNDNWDSYWADIEKWVKADGDSYAYYVDFGKTNTAAYQNWATVNGDYNVTGKYAPAIVNNGTLSAGFVLGTRGSAISSTYLRAGVQNALNYERAQYEAYQAYQAMKEAGYNCFAICSEAVNYQNGSPYIVNNGPWKSYGWTTSKQIGHSFMDFLAGGKAPLVFDFKRDESGAPVVDANYSGYYVMNENFFPAIDTAKLVESGK